MAIQSKNRKSLKIRVERALKRDISSFEVKGLFTFLDEFSESSKKYNSLDIKVDSNLVKER